MTIPEIERTAVSYHSSLSQSLLIRLLETNLPMPKGAEQMMGAIQWIDFGDAVHANENRP